MKASPGTPKSASPPKLKLSKASSPARRVLVIACVVGLVGAGLWVVWHRYLARSSNTQTARSDYVDPTVCASCHDDVAATYSKTGMGRSFYRPTVQNTVEDYSRNNTLDHKSSGLSYTMIEQDGKFFQRRHTTDYDGKETNVVDQQVDYVIGSGNHARTYLHRTGQGQLKELPVSWYTERSGSWAMSPGYDSANQEDVRRAITPECLFCHNGFPAPTSMAATEDEVNDRFPKDLPQGIDCQRCHGPGRAHVAAAQVKKPDPELVRTSIVNPQNLSRDRQLEVCMQCHLETSSRHAPNEVRAYDRGVLSYRPGQPLGDYKIYFDRVKDEKDDSFEVVHAAYRLRQSACFLKSQMTCLTCHDPHNIPRGEEATKTYIAACVNCHQSVEHRTAAPAGSNCITCHMPKRRTEDVVHVVMTEHFIRRYKPLRDLLAPLQEVANVDEKGGVVAYYATDAAMSHKSELYIAVAQVNDSKDLRSVVHLRDEIARLSPSAPEPYFALADALARRTQYADAIHWFEESLKRRPDFLPAIRGLVAALSAAGQAGRGIEVLQGAITRYPNDDLLLTNLGNLYLRSNRSAEASEVLTRALAVNSERADTHNLLGLVALKQGDAEVAEVHFREAIRWQPNLAEAQSNLGTLLTGKHRYEEAEFHLNKALGTDPDDADAHHGLGLLFILRGSAADATKELRQAAKLQPTNAQIGLDLADLLASQGQLEQAADGYREVLRLHPDRTDACLGLGLTLVGEHRASEAKPYLERAAASPDPDVSQSARSALSQIGR